jgi:hypothetical protein
MSNTFRPSTWLGILLIMLALAGRVVGQVTESPHTIEPGKILFEIDGVKLAYDRADAAGNKHAVMAVGTTIVSTGITRSFDVQVGADLFIRETVDLGGRRETSSGIGDLSFRMKWTFWQDEKRGAALAVIPYVRLPTSTGAVGTDHVEGGFIVPWAMAVPGGATAGAMFQWDQRRNESNDGYDARWLLTGFAQRAVTRRLSVYAEAEYAVSSTGFSDWEGTLGVGATYHFTAWLQLDYELLRGLNDRAMDWTHVLRVNWIW